MTHIRHSGPLAAIILWAVVFFALPSNSFSQDAPQAPVSLPENVQSFLKLLDQSDVQNWLRSQSSTGDVKAVGQTISQGVATFITARLVQIRERLDLVVAGAVNLETSLRIMWRNFTDQLSLMGPFRAVLQLLSVPLCAMLGAMALTYRARKSRSRQADKTDCGGTGQSLLGFAGFVGGCLLPLLLLNWTDILKQTAVIIALALAGVRLTILLGEMCLRVLSTSRASDRIAVQAAPETYGPPEGTGFPGDKIRHWHLSVIGLTSYFLIGWAIVELSGLFGLSRGAELLLVYILAFGLFAIALWAVWRRPKINGGAGRSSALAPWGWTAILSTLLFLWLSGFIALLWIGIFAVTLPFILPFCSRMVRTLMRTPDGTESRYSVTQVILLDRGLRAVIVALAALWLARMLGMEASSMATGETMVDKIARGILQGVIVMLVADLIWAFSKAQIEARLATTFDVSSASEEEKSRAARLRTLLPIFRNVLAAVIGIVAILMVLAGLGIEIAPLLAGAGVVGVAVGFGAQTIVKDVISGMFYLWDDAFRIGEYIETGKYKGTVESFSLRSVKLRHHRGPLTTVPFGELGAVQNMSRDWSVTKFNLRVAYDTDLEKLRKVIKKVGQDLAERPEYADKIISPLKMKGVAEFGEYAIEVRVGFTTKPGEQFMIRRDAMTSIRLAFRENGIHFAVPTVQVSSSEEGDDSDAAVAQMLRARDQQKRAEAAASGS